MSALRRTARHPGTAAASAVFERGRLTTAGGGVGIGIAPGLNEPAGFAVDLEQVLAGVPRRVLSIEPSRSACWQLRRARGRWPRTPLRLPNAARIWMRDKGRRR
jgi:hypothetical protein